MDIALVCIGFLFIIAGLIGSFLPIIPGPPLGWLGLLAIQSTDAVPMSWTYLGVTLVVALIIVILDYIIPAMGTKRFGGSTSGAIGTTVGLIVGLIAPIPMGVLIGPFVGALIGELVFNKTTPSRALKAAFGSFLGFLTSTFMKFIVSIVFFILFISEVITYRVALFF